MRQPIILVFVLACATWSSDNAGPKRHEASREQDVQAAVLDSFFTLPGTVRLVVMDSTVRGANHFVAEDYAAALRMLGDLPVGLREDFDEKRRHSLKIDSLPTRVPVTLFTAEDRAALRGNNPTEYWHTFHERFPSSSGRLGISRVGFSRNGRHALMLVDYGCGGLCGGTVYYLVAREGLKWRTVRRAQPRIS